MNGPVGVMIGAGKGVIRSMLCNGEFKSEVIPVDTAINGIIVIPYQFNLLTKKFDALHLERRYVLFFYTHEPERIPVYNLTVSEQKKRTWKWVMDVGRDFVFEYPFEVGLWYPDGNMTMNKVYHWFCVVMFMWLPAYLVDFLLLIFGQRRFMVRVQTKIANGLEVLQFFTTRSWDFKSTNFQQIYKDLSPADRKEFKINTDDVNDIDYMRTTILGGRQYVMKEPLSSIPRAKAQLKMLYFLDRFCKASFLIGVAYWLSLKVGIISLLQSALKLKFGNAAR